MPLCRMCSAPIFFLTEEPRDVQSGGGYPPRYIRTEPKPTPLDVNPDPAGNINLYENPSRTCVFVTHGGYSGPFKMFFRRNYGDVLLSMLRRQGVALYTSHFDTCPARKGGAARKAADADMRSRHAHDRGTP